MLVQVESHGGLAAMSMNTIGNSDAPARVRAQHASRLGAAEYAVPPAMLVVAFAIGLAGHLHFGLAAELAAAIGLAIFCVMLLCHVVMRPIETIQGAAKTKSPAIMSPRVRAQREAVAAAGAAVPFAAEPMRDGAGDETALTQLQVGVVPSKPVASDALPATAASAGMAAAVPPAQEQPVLREGEAWSYRPLDLKLPTVVADEPAEVTAKAALRPTIAEDGPAPAVEAAEPAVETESDRIDRILKRLAQQIRAGTEPTENQVPARHTDATAKPAADTAALPPQPAAEAATPAAAPARPLAAEARTDAGLQSAVDALRATVEAMRAGGRPKTSTGAPGSSAPRQEAPAMPTPAELRLAAVAEALAAERAEVLLDPILGLAEGSPRHFEISVRLRSRAGEVLDREAIGQAARGAGLLPVFDALGVRHSAGFALKLERHGRDGAVFSTVAGSTLESRAFVDDVAGRHSQGMADRLVLSFDQSEVAALGPVQMSALAELNTIGFRFALHGLANLDMDFEALADVGFEFVKLDAAVFESGLALAGAHVPPQDLARFLEDHDMTVIAGHIESEDARARMLSYGVALGQGALFGAPRAVSMPAPGEAMAAA